MWEHKPISTVQSGDGTVRLMLMPTLVLGAAIFAIRSNYHRRISQAGGLLVIGVAIWMGLQLLVGASSGQKIRRRREREQNLGQIGAGDQMAEFFPQQLRLSVPICNEKFLFQFQ